MIIDKRKIWPADSDGKVRIRIGFLEGPQWRQDEVEDVAGEWEDACPCISFKWTADIDDCDVRISFKGKISCSEVGTNATDDDDDDEPTMWLGYSSDDDLRKRHILHEFGHMLGAKHEHCSPDFPWRFDKKEVIKHYENEVRSDNPSWTSTEVKDEAKTRAQNNVLKKLDEKYLIYSDFDDQSVMLYKIKADWLQDNPDDPPPEDLEENYYLSHDDRKYMRKAYHCRCSRPHSPDLQPQPLPQPAPVPYPGGGVFGGMPDWWQARLFGFMPDMGDQ
ncbi:astacin [Aspergillus terreus]|uniref:Astacin n=1 Tax=Aspergillus terreus TaxID=33178 RepID=A0A5M3ZAD4_ASPTE|nr:hypothetical protein ATETN484_0010031100 [Aspergillus terreus]GFF18358.1 astacin [Aspergillus terreus]